jgi:quercetin dioxygenase-like cupin family protein
MNTEQKPRRVFINPVFKDKVTMLKTNEETGGLYTLVQLELYDGGKNMMHTHSAFEETFTAVEGTLGVNISNKKHYIKPGESITVPLHTPHHFFNDSGQKVVCQLKFVPGHSDFFKGMAIAYGLAADGKTDKSGIPKSLLHLALLVVLTDTKPTGAIGILFPLFKWLAKRARKKGIEQQLLEQYYYE